MRIRILLFLIILSLTFQCTQTNLNNPSDSNTKAYLETAIWNCIYRLVPCYEIKQQNQGIKQWTRLLGGTTAVTTNSLASATDFDGNNYIAGKVTGALPGQTKIANGLYTDIFLAKYDPNGNRLWIRQMGSVGNYHSDILEIHVDTFGDVIVTGSTVGAFVGYSSTDFGSLLIKFSSEGELLWSKIFYANATQLIAGVGITSDLQGNIYVTGHTELTNIDSENASGNYNLFVFKYDRFGTILWKRLLGGYGIDIYGVKATYDSSTNQIYVVGHVIGSGTFFNQTLSGSQDSFVLGFHPDGYYKWAKILGTTGVNLWIRGVSADKRGFFYIAGDVSAGYDGESFSGTVGELLVKFDSKGNREWTKLRGAGTGTTTTSRGIYADNAGNVYTVGWTNGNLSGVTLNGTQDAYLSKYHFNGNLEWTRLSGSSLVTLDGMALSSDRYGTIYLTGGTTGNLDAQTKTGAKDAFVIQYK
ncbi:SBBP repeat-containing protein [Leptospira kanakyensis]|uniref:SBBP repeat-containing protein n=1 Tax=Leptospira kanakyensis TaxID=2484968 RepID=UPI00223CE367|nr:SBBP repeat-containing protein [Leptospira kanakyensis]MCW7469323.1 SBBP repeat-containing protein [Leptospira kanakyensis]